MIDQASRQPQTDPRQEKFMVDKELLTKDQLNGLVEEYCTRYHGLNETENPLAESGRVLAEVLRGNLVVWFDPVENTASLGSPS
jgi:hypothetical protein